MPPAMTAFLQIAPSKIKAQQSEVRSVVTTIELQAKTNTKLPSDTQ